MGRATEIIWSCSSSDQAINLQLPACMELSVSPGEATFAEVLSIVSNSVQISLDIADALQAFRLFLEAEESVTVGKDQLKVLRSQAVHVLEEFAYHRRGGGDLSQVLPVYSQTLFEVSEKIRSACHWADFIRDTLFQSRLEVVIGEAFHKLAEQLQKITRENNNPLPGKMDLERARETDRKKVERVKLAIGPDQDSHSSPPHLDAKIKELIDHYSKLAITTDVVPELAQSTTNAKQILSAMAELSGQPVPPPQRLEDGLNFRIKSLYQANIRLRAATGLTFEGEYFTGQKVSIICSSRLVSQKAASKVFLRFSQLKENWTALRHDCIHPIHGLNMIQHMNGHMRQLYFIYPYLRNVDASAYLQMYPMTSESVRLQMILDVARGLNFMHSEYTLPDARGVVHGTLNIYNVLIRDSGRAVITAFGHNDVRECAPLEDPSLHPEEFDIYRYMGPELLDEEIPEPTYGNDIWSWAMTSLEILTSEPAFGRENKSIKLIRDVLTKQPERFDHAKIENYEHRNKIWQLFEDCWKRKPEDRPTANEVVRCLTSLMKKSINHNMSAAEILRLLSENGYSDITAQINEEKCSSVAISQGGAGDIYRGYLINGLKVAIKCPRALNTSEDEGRAALKSIAKEGCQWSKHRHENLLEILGLALFRNQIALVSPWMENGTILDYLKKCPRADRITLCSQVTRGVAYLHNQETIHGDLKAINVLVSKDGTAKIIDFGSTLMNQFSLQFSGEDKAHNFTLRWAAPECLDDAQVSKPADVYALAMTILEIVSGKLPFEHLTREVAVLKAICHGEKPRRPDDCFPTSSRDGNKLWGVLESCWKYNPGDRPTASDVKLALSEITQEGLVSVKRED